MLQKKISRRVRSQKSEVGRKWAEYNDMRRETDKVVVGRKGIIINFVGGCLKSQNARGFGHPEFISGSDIQCVGILKQVQDDEINDF
jgi:hypothetical protein